MDPNDFVSPTSGHLVPTIDGQSAFVPASLPPAYNSSEILSSLAYAMQAIGELKGACRRLANPYILIRPLQRNEALTSSAMEGTYTTDSNLILAEVGAPLESDDDTKEVINYLTALNKALQMLGELPICHRVIKQAHEILLGGLSPARGAQKRPGEYKREQNWIGGRTIDRARFIPPPPAEALRCMDELERYINKENTDIATSLIDLALVHYQIETIHPFSDGNGRIGRMLISLMAVHTKLLDMPVLYISPAMERHKDDYIDMMYNVSAKGEWVPWINFFFEKVAESCKETIRTIDRLIALQAEYKSKAGNAMRSASVLNLIDFLFNRPAIRVNEAADHLGVTYAAARGVIDRLIEIGILSEHPGSYPKLFIAYGILRASRPAVPASENVESSDSHPSAQDTELSR